MTDGRHDFDFLHGRWHVLNRTLVNKLDPARTEWTEFTAAVENHPILDGLGNIDRFSMAHAPPDNQPYEAIALRLFNPETRTWRIWWASTRHPGRLDPPLEGRFTDGHGTFYGDDELDGRAVTVRFQWHAQAVDSPRWEQAFSYDGGRSWTTNWIMLFSRPG